MYSFIRFTISQIDPFSYTLPLDVDPTKSLLTSSLARKLFYEQKKESEIYSFSFSSRLLTSLFICTLNTRWLTLYLIKIIVCKSCTLSIQPPLVLSADLDFDLSRASKLSNFAVWVEINGQAVPVYSKTESEDQKTVTCYIESEEGKQFVVRCVDFRSFHPKDSYYVEVCVDGE